MLKYRKQRIEQVALSLKAIVRIVMSKVEILQNNKIDSEISKTLVHVDK
jgi:hypothetical protein